MKKFKEVIQKQTDKDRELRARYEAIRKEIEDLKFNGSYDSGIQFLEKHFTRKVSSVLASLKELQEVFDVERWVDCKVEGVLVVASQRSGAYNRGAKVWINGYTKDKKKVGYHYYQGKSDQSGQRKYSYDVGGYAPMSGLLDHPIMKAKRKNAFKSKLQSFNTRFGFVNYEDVREASAQDLVDIFKELGKTSTEISDLKTKIRGWYAETIGEREWGPSWSQNTFNRIKNIKIRLRYTNNKHIDNIYVPDLVDGKTIDTRYTFLML